jgi:lysophospholipase L1-like esterase
MSFLDPPALSLAAVAAKAFMPPLAPYGPVTNRNVYPGQNFSDGTSQTSTYRSMHMFQEDTPFVVLCWQNGATGSANNVGLNDVTYGAAADLVPAAVLATGSLNSIAPVIATFRGADTVTAKPGGWVVSDPIAGPFKKGDTICVRTWVSVGTAGQKWPIGMLLNYGFEGILAGDKRAAQNFNTAWVTTGPGVAPCLILGPAVGRPSVVICGDSIADGSGDSAAFPGNLGFASRALEGVMGSCKITAPGERAASAVQAGNYYRRMVMAAHATHVLGTYGTNDVGTGSTLAQVQGDIISFARMFAPMKKPVWWTTVTPATDSTDSWATTANQTKRAGEAVRTALNTWLRAGAPMTAAFAPLAVGTAGAIVAGGPGHPLSGVFDVCAQIEVNAANVPTLNGGYWKVSGAANFGTSDGTHPSSAMHILMAAAIPAASVFK